MLLSQPNEKSSCGVGFLVNRNGESTNAQLQQALHALSCVEHRGACGADMVTGDGAGIMTDIPFHLFNYEPGSVAVATLFMPTVATRLKLARKVFEETFSFMGLDILEYRPVPTDLSVLGEEARLSLPTIVHVFIKRPKFCRTADSFNKLLYAAKQMTRTKERESGIIKEFFFTSLSTTTIVYKALTRAPDLCRFYLDLQEPSYKTRFALFHRRFSTNTRTSWDKAQPFRLIAHNGEINTIAGNRSWSYSREQSLGLPVDELLTHHGISDSGSLNEMVEALKYRSSIPHCEDILAIMIPPAEQNNSFYRFWSRAMEPWDGPAFISYSDGETIGARLDRNGFRPCRWTMTESTFYLCSEAGAFKIDPATIVSKGTLHAGSGVTVELTSGRVHFEDPSRSRENFDTKLDPRLLRLDFAQKISVPTVLEKKQLFNLTQEDYDKVLLPMIAEGKEAIGSMGDTARPAILSDQPRSFFDYFYHDFAQVTNPPLDYLREKMVTDLVTFVGRRPNIFAPKELIPPVMAIELPGPVLSLGQMTYFQREVAGDRTAARIRFKELDLTFRRDRGVLGFRSDLTKLCAEALNAVEHGANILVLSDRNADFERLPMPSLLVLRALMTVLTKAGVSLEASLIVHSGEIRTTHQIAALISFGATAVCPYLALEIARFDTHKSIVNLDPEQREKNLIKALESGLLKIMSKMGISVVRSYQNSQLFTAIGLGDEIISEYFPKQTSPIGGIGLDELVGDILKNADLAASLKEQNKLVNTYQFKEHNKGLVGEKHSMTNTRSQIIHRLVRDKGIPLNNMELYREYLAVGEQDSPVNLRHLLDLKPSDTPLTAEQVQDRADILKLFGSGAMSFGAISAESQRDIFLAMREIGGRSNSGEGGENPYYFRDGTTASIKQVASARFGVTAEYLISSNEYQIKIAQGAKPGEGGQLMGVKVGEEIARARHSNTNVDLISPPPLHDIYSIEDLKELIFALRSFNPKAEINVKLVSGANIGTIAVGVAKAGANTVHISGHDGGTGAASLSSMKHAGLPWELGLAEVHRTLIENGLRTSVKLRVDGGLSTGKDIAIAAILGADEFDFGKLLLVAEGCVMARICEKNTCPTGIATHNPKFKAKYKGTPEHIVKLLHILAEDAQAQLMLLGVSTLRELRGRHDLLRPDARHRDLMARRKISLEKLLGENAVSDAPIARFDDAQSSALNRRIVEDAAHVLEHGGDAAWSYSISTGDRAVLAGISAEMARKTHQQRMEFIRAHAAAGAEASEPVDTYGMDFGHRGTLALSFNGSAGQGFGVFAGQGLNVVLEGEANDSVCKSMSGGTVVIKPPAEVTYPPAQNSIIGNCALYGATGGKLFVYGLAGDRFAVRNSGAISVVEGAGLHACEYMTNGIVVILGKVSHNVGAGMTGGTLFMRGENESLINSSYITRRDLSDEDSAFLQSLLEEYRTASGSTVAQQLLAAWDQTRAEFSKFVPIAIAAGAATDAQADETADDETLQAQAG